MPAASPALARVAINTILGSVVAEASGIAIVAAGTGAGNVTVSTTDNREITATVAALSAAATAGNAVALGAAVALNLIGWNGTVADETEDSQDPIIVNAGVIGGSINAGGKVSITATSESTINATTAAVAVAIGISLTGSGSGEEGSGGGEATEGEEGTVAEGEGGSPTSAEEEGEGETRSRSNAVDETNTDEGQANGTEIDEGADNAGGAETNEAEDGGTAAGESGNTAGKESGAQQGSATSTAKGVGQGAGLLVGLGGVVNSSQSGSSASPDFTTDSTQSATDVQNLTAGQTVQLDSNYVTPTYYVGTNSTQIGSSSTVNPGNVVNDNGVLYRYIGTSATTADFQNGATPPDFTDTTQWAQIGGVNGDTYQYIGPSGSVDLNNQDYTNASLWSDITGGNSSGSASTSSVPAGVITGTLGAGLAFLTGGSNPTTPPASKGGGEEEAAGGDGEEAAGGEESKTDPEGENNPDESATPDSAEEAPADESGSEGGGGEGSESVSAAGVYTENKIATVVTATVQNTTTIITGSGSHNGLSVTASDTSTIHSFDGAASVTADFSDQSSNSITIGIGIARNTIQDTVAASVTNAGTITASNAPITISATQSGTIDATSLAAALAVSGGAEGSESVAGGGSLADNLIGTDTTATLSGTTIGASGAGNAVGALNVTATDSSIIDADVAAISADFSIAGEGASAVGIGASLAHNRIGDGTDTGDGTVSASITDSTIHSGAIDVGATSSQTITATVEAARCRTFRRR